MNRYDFSDIIEKFNKQNRILFSRNSASLQELLKLFRSQKHRTLVLWAFHFVRNLEDQVRSQSEIDLIISDAIFITEQWAKGIQKMPYAKKAILSIHSLAKRTDNAVLKARYHAIAQGLSAVHVETHAIGLVFYELTATVLENGINRFEKQVQDQIERYKTVLNEIVNQSQINDYKWAPFLLDDSKPNKEQLLYEKKQLKACH